MTNLTATLPGYQILEQIYEGTRTLVYRGLQASDRKPVVVKLLRNEYPSFNELVQFRNQYTIAKNLDIPEVVQPKALESYRNSYALIMEDFGGISLHEYAGLHSLNLSEFLPIAIQIVSSLEGLYRHRVIHKDIKPSNILINPTTKQVKLIDFSIASLLPRETQVLLSPNVLEGTLSYLSPEQTGRMNRGIDYRTDFYSLGVSFYELLTGQLPFQSEDPMELVHCHIAKQPAAVHILNPKIPPILSDIVSILMAKNAEDRYQSALGLKHDLEICLDKWQETGKIEPFKLRQRDICDRFIIPEKLYGRQTEVRTLLAAFDRVASLQNHPVGVSKQYNLAQTSPPVPGKSEMMLVAGFSGIGKTAVVNEIHKPIVRQRGYFIKGKFDQFQRNIPFSAFVQAFRDLMGQLLTESDAKIELWKNKILAALGESSQVIIEFIPELEKIIGKQPAVTELSGSAAQNRFNLLFPKFIQVFTDREHPLVIFLDDLQWADSASLKLMQLLMSDLDTRYLLLIGAYRDNEVSAGHPLAIALQEIGKTATTMNTITLTALNFSDLNYLISDTLSCSPTLASPLTTLVYQKTKGNPFFANQFLKALHEDGLINFNFVAGYWQCDLAEVTEMSLTDDVVEFMALQLQKLPRDTQEVLKLAACIGNQFDLATLAIVREKSEIETAVDLWKALQEGLILPQNEVYKFFQNRDRKESLQLPLANYHLLKYKFLHDRVQQAAYVLIPESQKKSTNLKIGRSLLYHTSIEEREEKIFAIVNQLNVGIELISDRIERKELAKLNLSAGQKAKSSTAYAAAFKYSKTGIKLLFEDSWESDYKLTVALYELAAETAYLSGNFEKAENFMKILLPKANTVLEKIKTYETKIQMYAAQNQMQAALDTGLQVLKMLDISLLEKPPQNLAIEELYTLAEMTDPYQRAAMRIIMSIQAPAYHSQPEILPFLPFTMVDILIKYGNCPTAAYAYVFYGFILCMMSEIELGYQYGKLALQMLEKYETRDIKARVNNMYNCFIRHWKESAHETLEVFRESAHTALENGDLEFVGYAAFNYCHNLFLVGEPLEYVENQFEEYINLLKKVKQEFQLQGTQIWGQLVHNLRGEVSDKQVLVGERFDETTILENPEKSNQMSLFCAYLSKSMLAYLFGDYSAACELAEAAEKYSPAMSVLFPVTQSPFYYSLALLAKCSGEIPEIIATNQEKMKAWADYAPINFQHKYDLVEAEKARVLGQKLEAIEYYDRAIAGAKKAKYIHEEAIANELAGKFYLEWGKEKIAQTYLTEAYYCYARWGSSVKIEDLENRYPDLLSPIFLKEKTRFSVQQTITLIGASKRYIENATVTISSHSTSASEALDLLTVIKASQTLSSQIQFDRLLETLMQVLMENAGANKCALILPKEENWVVEAIADVGETQASAQSTVLHSIPIEESQEIPVSAINYVKRTLETLVIQDATTDTTLAADTYLLWQQPKSLLCAPILYQGRPIGIVYLENRLTVGAFTCDRLEVIHVLCSQAAICLENAHLYQQSKNYSQKLEQYLRELQEAQLHLIQSEKMSALGDLVSAVAHEINNPIGFIAGNVDWAKTGLEDLISYLQLYQEKFPHPGKEIEEKAEEIELDYLLEDLPKMLGSMKNGTDRIRNISNSLRTFSRADSTNKILANIHEGLDSTLTILQHRLKAKDNRPAIQTIKEYGDIPPVKCYFGQLNQVFMNILSNAIDSIEESNESRNLADIKANPNTITIATKLSADRQNVVIRIKDNGRGISEEVKSRVFDHLFTTKSIGKGTGLGLSISRQIVEETHKGSLNFESVLGQGAEFTITIPLHQS